MRCVYCIPAHAAFARAAGATEEEIKTAVAIAADVALNSSMLYGSQFDMDTFMKMFERLSGCFPLFMKGLRDP